MAARGGRQPPSPGAEEEAPRARKRRAPSWTPRELEALLDLWEEEEGLHDLQSRRRNAELYTRMARNLAQQGHPSRNCEQVRSKVKELRLGYVRATEGRGAGPDACPYFERLNSFLGEPAPQGPAVPVDTCQQPPIIRPTEPEEEDESGGASGEEASVATQQAPSSSSSVAGEEPTAGPSTRPATPAAAAPPAAQARRTRLRHRDQLLRRHVTAVEGIQTSIAERVQGDQEWRHEGWAAFLEECREMRATMGTLTLDAIVLSGLASILSVVMESGQDMSGISLKDTVVVEVQEEEEEEKNNQTLISKNLELPDQPSLRGDPHHPKQLPNPGEAASTQLCEDLMRENVAVLNDMQQTLAKKVWDDAEW
ncbi:uncharacterized protein LOC142830642 [Pelodiscus sinensis]|uniref:uncharacterized protein LOC142830642 n=1 Tax=Pelodiscus sinensis TaxID=13735 RepID=UPI003F6CBF60